MGSYGVDIDAAMTAQVQHEMDERGWTQVELANKAGISTSAMSRYVHGRRKMDVETFADIADALGMSYWELANRAQRRLDGK